MPSKYGFGNTRTASPYKLASYGSDQKNPIQMGGPTGAGDRDHMLGSAERGRGYEKSSPAEMKSSPTKQILPIIKAAGKATKWVAKHAKLIRKHIPKPRLKKPPKVNPAKSPKVNPAKTSEGKYAEFTKEISNNPKLSKTYNELFIKNMNKYYKLDK